MFIYCHSDDERSEEEESASGDGKNKICPTHQPDSSSRHKTSGLRMTSIQVLQK